MKGTQRIAEMGGLTVTHPVLGWGLIAGVAAIAGLPPFGVFTSEFLVISSTFAREPLLAIMIPVTSGLIESLRQAGIECFLQGSAVPLNTTLEPPCSLKWMAAHHSLFVGAFSYAVSGYYFHVSIGRYTSIGEQVQIGRSDHPTSWLSTSPAFYLPGPLFDVGREFDHAAAFHEFRPNLPAGANPTTLKQTVIGNDVYIGHAANGRHSSVSQDGRAETASGSSGDAPA